MINLEMLGSVATHIHADLRIVFYMLLPVLFGLSLAGSWIRNPAGDPEYLLLIKRSVVAGVLLSGFTEIANAICDLTSGLAGRISSMDGLESYVRMVNEKAAIGRVTPVGLVFRFNDYLPEFLSIVSVFALYIVKVLMLSVYQFAWMFLIIISPVMLSLHVISSRFTATLFQGLTEIACWKIVWAVLSAFLTAIPYGNTRAAEHGYATLIILNVIVVVAMIMTPIITHTLIGGSFATVAATAGALTTAQVLRTPQRIIRATDMMLGNKKRPPNKYARKKGSRWARWQNPSQPQRRPEKGIRTASKKPNPETKIDSKVLKNLPPPQPTKPPPTKEN
jgi:hypothetical protein